MPSGNPAPALHLAQQNVIPAVLVATPGSPAVQAQAVADAWQVLQQVMDPEIPVVSVVDLGMVRSIDWRDGHLHIIVTPTYSGCPATDTIESDIRSALRESGFIDFHLQRRLSPPWTSDWITPRGRERLRACGIAPPAGSASKRCLRAENLTVNCPHCGSAHTQIISEFGSTACKALYRCTACLEPFDYFKCI